jgi:DNA-binding transcriptional MerR regulator
VNSSHPKTPEPAAAAPITLLLVADAAELVGRSPSRIRYLADVGRLPVAARTPGGTRLFEAAAIERLAAELDGKASGHRRCPVDEVEKIDSALRSRRRINSGDIADRRGNR